jgi:hypothetical protein
MTELFNAMHPIQQLEMCGAMSKWMKPTGQLALPMPANKNVFQVEEEAVLMAAHTNHVFIGEEDNHQHIIIDTGSSYNLIGRHLLPSLEEKMKEAGTKLTIKPAGKRFQLGGTTKTLSTAKVIVPLLLGDTRVETEVYVVDGEIPFLLGGNILRQYKTEISVSDNTLIVNNQQINLITLNTGHMAIPWESKIHKVGWQNQVLMTITVPENKWGHPDIKKAMQTTKENLKIGRVYKEVKHEPWMPTLQSKWIIKETIHNDGVGEEFRSKIVVRGYQDLNEDYTPYVNPSAHTTTVRLMMATAANLGWRPKTIKISKTYTHGTTGDKTIYVKPPIEVDTPGIAWELLNGEYGQNEADRLWYEDMISTLIYHGGREMIGDPSCILFHKQDVMVGFVIVHEDDITTGGTPEIEQRVLDAINNKFRVPNDQKTQFTYLGMEVRIDRRGEIILNTNQHIEMMREKPIEIKYGKVGEMKHLSLEIYSHAEIEKVNGGVKSMMGYIILLRGEQDKCSTISFNQSTTRLCNSKASAESFAMQNAMCMAIRLGKQLRQMQTGRRHENPALIHAITSSQLLTMSLLIAMKTQAMNKQVERSKVEQDHQHIESITWVAIEKMLADPLTRWGVDTTALRTVLRTGRWERPT